MRILPQHLDRFNSMTKYPSILTYHDLGEKGKLVESLTTSLNNGRWKEISEKVDGTNTRIVASVDDGDYFIGSREEFLWAKGDRVYNPSQGIVSNVTGFSSLVVDGLADHLSDCVCMIYGELYGGRLDGAKQYTHDKQYSYRVFDIAVIDNDKVKDLMNIPREQIASWRDHGGQRFLSVTERDKICKALGLPTVPCLGHIMPDAEFPVTIKETYEFLKKYNITKAGIDFFGNAEGIVIRDDEGTKVKLRFEDYEKTLGIYNNPKKKQEKMIK